MSRTRTRAAAATAADRVPMLTQILDAAERLVQTRGFNGFSYADIADELRITKAALHYHFASKADLGQALIERYTAAFGTALSAIEGSRADRRDQLQRYVDLYADVLSKGRLCLCGMLAAEYMTLPAAMKAAIRQFFDANESWLTEVLEEGRRTDTLAFDGDAVDAARALTAALEGGMLLARSYGNMKPFAAAAAHALREFTPAREPKGRGRAPARRRRGNQAQRGSS